MYNEKEYLEKYGSIPKDYDERLQWLCNQYRLTPKDYDNIIAYRDAMIDQLYYMDYKVTLYENPEGAKRPRFRFITKKNVATAARDGFVHVYSPDAAAGHKRMHELLTYDELYKLDYLVTTPAIVTYNAYFQTPKSFNTWQTFLAEIGLIRHLSKPDWDNIGKKYSDMYNANVWLDDAMTVTGIVNKYYSVLPRIEIDLKFLNAVYTKPQWKTITGRKDFPENVEIPYFDKGELKFT